jgi:NAD(P)-dependent dehydrogenase (short-subunit alcohol dehydrogenase family)
MTEVMMSKIEGKSALITGGTRGIGLAIAEMMLARGARVFICGTHQRGVDDAVGALESVGQIEGAVCNVRSYPEVRELVRQADRRLGGIDVLVNNAGIGCFSHVAEMSPEDWLATIEINLNGVFYCCREVVPLMKGRGGGYIVNIGSLAGKNAFPGGAAYNASKFGLIGFSEALMQEVRHDHIRVSYVMPGSVNTEFGRSAAQDPASTWKLLPEDVAETVAHLLEMDPRALPSRVELRPSEPKK